MKGVVATSVSQRARRVLVAVIVVLLTLLLVTGYFLSSVLRPPGVETAREAAAEGGLEWVRSIYGYGTTEDEQLNAPNDVAIAPNGTIWVTDQARARVLGFTPDGDYLTLLHKGPRGSSDEALAFPAALAVDEDGLIYIGDFMKDEIVVMTSDNEIVDRYVVPAPLSVDVRGDRIVAGSAAGFVIMDKAGTIVELLGTRGTGDDQFDGVKGVTIGEDGTIYVIDQYNNRVSAYTADGVRLWIVETGPPGNRSAIAEGDRSVETSAPAAMLLPARLVVDRAGRLVVIDPFDFSMTVLDSSDGSLISKHGQFGQSDGQFTYPTGIDYDPARDWFAVADTGNGRVQIVRIPGSGGTAVEAVRRSLSGPLRLLCIPATLIPLLLLIAWLLRRRRATVFVQEFTPNRS